MHHASAEQTAMVLAEIFRLSEQNRARVSERTLRWIGRRERLHYSFIESVIGSLSDYGLALFPLGSGGFGLIPTKSLEAAKPITAKRFLKPADRKAIRKGLPVEFPDLMVADEDDEDGEDD